jgi:hypothetical protein
VLTTLFVLGGSLFAFCSPAVCQQTSVRAGKQFSAAFTCTGIRTCIDTCVGT